MTIVGGGMEMIGFSLIVYQLVRVQRQEFGWPQFVVRTRAWVMSRARRLLKRPQVVHVGGVDSAETVGSVRIRKRFPMGQMAPDRFAAVEYNVNELERELDERFQEALDEVEKVRSELSSVRGKMDQREAERDAQRKAELRSSLAFEAWGVVFFLSGTVLSVIGSV
jgi:hypothetical protein